MPRPAYVNSGTYQRLIVSAAAGTVSGLTLVAPGSLVIGNLLILHIGTTASANAVDDVYRTTQPSGIWTLLGDQNLAAGLRSVAWWKFVTGTVEPDVRVLVTAVGTAGSVNTVGVIHQFRNVRNTGTATVIEAGAVTSQTGISGPVADQGVIVTAGNRLAVNLFCCNNGTVSPSVSPVNETGGDWTVNSYGPTGTGGCIRVWTAPMPAAGTIDGGTVPGPAGAHGYVVRGFALAPCDSNMIPRMHHYIMMSGAH